jgi:hypothetical protein
MNVYEFYEYINVLFVEIDIIPYLCEFISVLGSQGSAMRAHQS